MKCQSTFTIPKIDTVTWMFASNVRSDVISQFKVLHIGDDDTLTIQNVKIKNTGTYACNVFRKDTLLLQRFFYLIVMRSTLQSSIELQAMFQNVLLEKRSTLKTPTAKPVLPPAKQVDKQTEIQFTAAVALATLFVVLSIGAIYRWVTRSK
ncbi:sperm acrosome membrane-associated protein 6 isoform X2 [Heterodontus francisci]